MSASEEDIQASAAITNMKPKSLAGDTAHHFRAREIIEVSGDLSGLSDIATAPAPAVGKPGRFVSLLDDDGHLDADLLIASHEDKFLVDVHADLASSVAERLSSLKGVTGVDRSANERWRIFGELPDQKGADTPYDSIRFADTRRRELGVRVFRDAQEPEGFDWRHARKWDGHALRLGVLPDHRCVLGKKIKLQEAGYHRLGAEKHETETVALQRRVLPVRIDTYSLAVPVMIGAPLLIGDFEFGIMLDHEGVCGVGLVTLEPWRQAVMAGERMTCLGEPIQITWPTWLSSESEGRVGPAGQLI